ncbi:MAG TPA: arylamine N-acetyltransferase [Streptosporangiaceae bacterium]|jgi:N-hydroxyarylamine O-acetyltransferase
MDDQAADEYLKRIGVVRPDVLGAASLRELHEAHLVAVPFENLSIHLGEQISLAEDALVAKIVARQRGGFCYELNGAFSFLLEALGAEVRKVSARVHGSAGLGPPFDHMALLVRLADGSGPWLADVGFGSHSNYPLLLDSRQDQDDPGGTFRLADAADGDVDVLRNGEPQYRVELRARAMDDFAPTCWWQQTWPQSHFREKTVCSRLIPGGRVTISARTLIETSDGARSVTRLRSDAELLTAYRERFGINLDRVPRLGRR